MTAAAITPLKLAVRFDPPVLALVYSAGSSKRFLHEFPLNDNHLLSRPEDVLANLMQVHPGYLDKVKADQVVRLISMIQDQYEQDPNFEDQQGMEEFLQEMKSKMTEEQYQDFVAKLESGEIVIDNGEYEEEEDDRFNDRLPRDNRKGFSPGSEEENGELSEEDFGF